MVGLDRLRHGYASHEVDGVFGFKSATFREKNLTYRLLWWLEKLVLPLNRRALMVFGFWPALFLNPAIKSTDCSLSSPLVIKYSEREIRAWVSDKRSATTMDQWRKFSPTIDGEWRRTDERSWENKSYNEIIGEGCGKRI